jgi:hypothetical protein
MLNDGHETALLPSISMSCQQHWRSAVSLSVLFLQLSLRSLNNLDERFHHSYFLYLLTSLEHFVTVEMYIIPLVLLIAALLLKVGKSGDHLGQRAGATTRLGLNVLLCCNYLSLPILCPQCRRQGCGANCSQWRLVQAIQHKQWIVQL